jgi:predicted nucleotidyltransferase
MTQNQPEAAHLVRINAFLERLRRWVQPRTDVRALAIVGSVARGEARPDSDLDVVLLTNERERYVGATDWTTAFGPTQSIALEDYGKVTSVRALYRDGLEVEFAIAPPDWASVPLGAGTEQVVRDGFIVVMDRDGHATALASDLSSRADVHWIGSHRSPVA